MSVTINGTTGIAGVDGSASTPAYQGADTNTGIAFPAADTVSIATGGTERMRVDSSGNVGIGTTSPGQKLHVSGNTGSTIVSVGDNTLTEPYVYLSADASSNIGTLFTRSNHPLTFGTNNDERMRIDSSGNVGIGTTSPTSVSGSTVLNIGGSSSSTTGRILLRDISSNNQLQIIVNAGASYNEFDSQQELNLRTEAGAMRFSTVNTERMRIATDGKVLINTTSAYGSETKIAAWTTNSGCYEANGTTDYYPFVVFRSGTQRGSIYQSGTSTAYNTSSDYRLKENIAPMIGALEKVAQLKPCTYTWIETGQQSQGFIAHELQEVVPECVTGEKDAVNEDGSIKPQGIDTSFLVATLTAAIQELKAITDTQAQTIAALEAKVTALEGAAQ